MWVLIFFVTYLSSFWQFTKKSSPPMLWHMLWLTTSMLFNQWLAMNTNIMQYKNPFFDTKPTIHCDNFPSVVDWLCHVEHESWGLGMQLKFCWKARFIVGIFWTIVSLLQLYLLLQNKHKSRTVMVEPWAHAFVKTVNPQWDIVFLVGLIKGIKNLTDIKKLV